MLLIKKDKFLKKVHVRELYDLPRRTRVGDGLPKKKESKQILISVRKSYKFHTRKSDATKNRKPSKVEHKREPTAIPKPIKK